MKNKYIITVISIALFSLSIGTASAHVVVKPSQVGVASFQTFTMGVPVEKDMPTIAIKLEIPGGLKEVSPTVKPGWKISETKNGDSVTEIIWTSGTIPVGERDDFSFSAQAPAQATTLDWKAYQTYADGTIVAWDMTPSATTTVETPYSMTSVVNDLAATSSGSSYPSTSSGQATALIISAAALVLSFAAISIARKSRRMN